MQQLLMRKLDLLRECTKHIEMKICMHNKGYRVLIKWQILTYYSEKGRHLESEGYFEIKEPF